MLSRTILYVHTVIKIMQCYAEILIPIISCEPARKRIKSFLKKHHFTQTCTRPTSGITLSGKELKFKMDFHYSAKWKHFSRHQNIFFLPSNNEFKIQDDSEVLSILIDLSSLCNLTVLNSLHSTLSSKSFLTLMTVSKLSILFLFCGKNYWKYKSYWYTVLFLLEAIEANICYFFENRLMKLKFPNLRKIQIPSNKIYCKYEQCPWFWDWMGVMMLIGKPGSVHLASIPLGAFFYYFIINKLKKKAVYMHCIKS